jgi:hypothetical protein
VKKAPQDESQLRSKSIISWKSIRQEFTLKFEILIMRLTLASRHGQKKTFANEELAYKIIPYIKKNIYRSFLAYSLTDVSKRTKRDHCGNRHGIGSSMVGSGFNRASARPQRFSHGRSRLSLETFNMLLTFEDSTILTRFKPRRGRRSRRGSLVRSVVACAIVLLARI